MRKFLSLLVALTFVAGSPFIADAAGKQSMSEKVDDAKITSKVKAKLTKDRAKNLVAVNVDTKDGVVHLQGTVPSEEAKATAERLAKGTDGVVSVTNDLKIKK